MVFNRPYVIVFANWLPKVRCMSLDRWDIRQFIDGGNIKAVDAYALLQEEEGLVENPHCQQCSVNFWGISSFKPIHPILDWVPSGGRNQDTYTYR